MCRQPNADVSVEPCDVGHEERVDNRLLQIDKSRTCRRRLDGSIFQTFRTSKAKQLLKETTNDEKCDKGPQ